MKNKQWYEWLLPVTFAAMLGLCLALNLTGGQKEGLSNIIVNGAMFLIVAVIFLNCDLKSFVPMDDIIADLGRVTGRIRTDAMNSHDYLMEPYASQNTELFKNETLKRLYQDYLFEIDRLKDKGKSYYKADIENYISAGLVDSVMHRNQLNQVAGALTGLGILGTFIGLSLGLQQFNTGSTAQITSSIEPLMDGIKVAFHTSIYGMIFSLVFNYVYKRKLYDAEEAVKEFTAAWKKFVVPDTEDAGVNRMIELEEEQLAAFNKMGERISEEIARQLDPNFEKLGKLISDFQAVATADQREALTRVVNEFTKEMNTSLDGTFTKVAAVVNEQFGMLQKNADMMNEYYRQAEAVRSDMAKDMLSLEMQTENNKILKKEWAEDMQAVVDACAGTAERVDSLKDEVEKLAKSRRRV